MTMPMSLRMATVVAMSCVVAAAPAEAQCRPPAGSHEARLLAFYVAPTVFSLLTAPQSLEAGSLRLGVEVVPVPSPSSALQHPEYCYQNTTNNTRLAPVFGRPRVTVGLPAGFVLEGSYLPNIVVSAAQASLASLSLARSQDLPLGPISLTLQLRAHGTVGRIRGAITCPRGSLQTDDAGAPCYGREPSRDTFEPNAFGIEAALGAGGAGHRIATYVGGGASWLHPRFRAGFTDAQGNVDRTTVAVDLVRGTAFAGARLRLRDALAVAAEVYAVPADATTLRLGVAYRVR